MAKIALFGAAGAVGKSIAAALQNDNTPYRVVGRSRNSLQTTFGADPLAEVTTWNPDDPASVRQAADGLETIIYLVGVDYRQFALHPVLIRPGGGPTFKIISQIVGWRAARRLQVASGRS